MKSFRILIILVLIVFLSSKAYNQEFAKAVGIKAGYSFGVTYRYFATEERAFEGILGFRMNGMQLIGIREFFKPANLKMSDNFYYSYGYGGHFGFTNTDKYRFLFFETYYDDKKVCPVLGLDAFFSFEYRIQDIPLIIAIEYRPMFEFSTRQIFNINFLDLAFAMKYQLH